MNTCSVRPYTPVNWSQIAPLVEAWPFKPMSRHGVQRESNLVKITSAQVRTALGNKDGTAWVALKGREVRGFTGFSMLPWDSEQLGVSAARLDYLVASGSYDEQRLVKDTLLENVLGVAHDRGVWHLSARVDSSDLSSLYALEEAGFITVDAILTFACELSAHQPAATDWGFKVRLATAADSQEAGELARNAYAFDRFHSDPFIDSDRADELHATWVRNSCAGRAADAVIIAEDESGILGFATCSVNRNSRKNLERSAGTIILVATAARARGRGVGQATTMAAIEWFREQGCGVVEVGTQLRNVAASRLYQKCGFSIVGSSVSLRKLL